MANLRATSLDWTQGVPAAEASVRCGHDVHTLRWALGVLELVDHADLDAERALVGLGGETCACLELLAAWEQHQLDPAVLILGPRDRFPLSTAEWNAAVIQGKKASAARRRAPQPRHVRHDAPAPAGPVGPEDAAADDRLEALMGLDSAIPHRLVSTVAAALADRTREPDLWPLLRRALHHRVEAAIGRWSSANPEFVLEMADAGEEPSITRPEEDASLTVRLPFTWLRDVWARELAVLDGEFVLSAEVFEPGLLKVVSVDRDLHRRVEPVPYSLDKTL